MSRLRRAGAPLPVSIAPLARAHAAALAQELADPRVSGTFSRCEASTAGALGAVERELTGRGQGVLLPFTIFLGRTIVGLCGLSRQNRPFWERGVYYWVGFEHWGKGIATRAVGLLVASGVLDESVTRLTSLVLVRNPASHRVLENNGFRIERTFTASEVDLPGFEGEPVWELARPVSPAEAPDDRPHDPLAPRESRSSI